MTQVNIQKTPLGPETTVFAPSGELDAFTGPQLREELTRAVEEGQRWLVLDMAKVEYIDSVGLGIIVGAAKKAAAAEGNLAVVAPRPNVRRVFEISGTSDLLNVVDSLEVAKERLGWSEDQPGACGGNPAPAEGGEA